MNKPVVGVLLGDHAGIGPEVTVKAMAESKNECVFVVIANGEIFEETAERFAPAIKQKIVRVEESAEFVDNGSIYLIDLPLTGEIQTGAISAASGQIMIDSMMKATAMKKSGHIDGIFLGPLTKASLHEADPEFQEEAQLFAQEFGVKDCGAFVKCLHVLRATVTGHCSFKEILEQLTVDSIYHCGLALYDMARIFGTAELGMAVAALNPHAGEGGLFGNDEQTLLEPAIEKLKETLQVPVVGPCPADTVLHKCVNKEVGALLYLFHDQGNLAIKSWRFNDGVTCFVKLPCMITSPGHGSALDIAGKGIADHHNACCAMKDLLTMIMFEKAGNKPWQYSVPELYQ